MRATGGVHEREVGETLVGEAQAGGGAAAVARRESGCAEPGNGAAGHGELIRVSLIVKKRY